MILVQLVALLWSVNVLAFAPEAFAREQNYVRLYFMPTGPEKIQWGSPKELLVTTLSATLFNSNHSIGHVNVEVFCEATGVESERHFWTGSVSLDKTQSGRFLADDKIGFTISSIAWPGRLETEDEIHESLTLRGNKKGYLSALTYQISGSTCRRLVSYYDETVHDSHPRYYGFAARPRRHEGAGCSAYATSFLEVAGLMTADLDTQWTRRVRIPLTLMSGYLSTGPITVRQVLKSPDAQAWATTAPHMELGALDPDLMHEWLLRTASSIKALRSYNARPDASLRKKYPKIVAIRVDARSVKTPTEDLFVGPFGLTEVRPNMFFRTDVLESSDGSFQLLPNN